MCFKFSQVVAVLSSMMGTGMLEFSNENILRLNYHAF